MNQSPRLVKRAPNEGALAWADGVSSVALSVVTVEEIFFGLALKPNQRIQAWMDDFLAEECEICPVTMEVARCAGLLRGNLAARGQRRTQADMLIAATAQVRQLTLVTRNVRDFEGCGISLLDPFS